ncbi:NADPH-dependent FMN reductase [Nocardioides stalactiti]|uniref:NADPH-dependent FMN reductase n=1 Tax=Nocardioides stalactiti TaxID=2755356 RepID=UPI0015FF866D|nr:NAD(P)H-dependent oxidoreductase [Nocardioides stalactiti]
MSTAARPTTAVVVGNPKAGSRTLAAASYVVRELTGEEPDLVVDLATIGAELVDWHATSVNDLVAAVGRADLVVVACPTYKATYTGLLKLFLDRFSVGQLAGVAVPLMLGAGPAHALAPETGLRPLLSHLGALVPTPGLYVLDSAHDDPAAYADWLVGARPAITALLTHPRGATA